MSEGRDLPSTSRDSRKTVVVTGVAGGIGGQIARQLVGEGYEVVGIDRAVGTQPLADGFVVVGGVDCARDDEVRDALAAAGLSPARLTGLVNSAGLFEIANFVSTTVADWRRDIDANLMSTVAVTHAVLPMMISTGQGSIVNISSAAGEVGSARPAALYAAAKAGVIGFTKSLAREVGESGVRVNAVSPGPVQTAMLQAGTDEAKRTAAARTLLGRIGTPEDIANAVSFLLSESASWITGEVLRVNGGSVI